MQKLHTGRGDIMAQMRDPNMLADVLPVVDRTLEQLHLHTISI